MADADFYKRKVGELELHSSTRRAATPSRSEGDARCWASSSSGDGVVSEGSSGLLGSVMEVMTNLWRPFPPGCDVAVASHDWFLAAPPARASPGGLERISITCVASGFLQALRQELLWKKREEAILRECVKEHWKGVPRTFLKAIVDLADSKVRPQVRQGAS